MECPSRNGGKYVYRRGYRMIMPTHKISPTSLDFSGNHAILLQRVDHQSNMDLTVPSSSQIGLLVPMLILGALSYRIIYTQFFHPLSFFPGPWYLTSFSFSLALISLTKREPEYLMYLIHKYGSTFPRCPATTRCLPSHQQ